MTRCETVLRFWRDELGPKGWYAGGDEIDELIRSKFEDLWKEAAEGALGHWLTDAEGVLAYILLTDQFPRNMFRGSGQAFDLDPNARAASKFALSENLDQAIEEPLRQFFFMPLMHSENLVDQDRSVACFRDRMPETGADNLSHARAHRWIIRRFGRFPFRNAALNRKNTNEEAEFMANGGYKFALQVTNG